MAEEATDVAPEITLEEFDGEQETPKAESSPAEKEPVAEAKEEAPAEPKAEEKETETEGEPEPTDETETDEKPLAPKSENRFQKLANENRTLKEQVEELTSQVYQPKTTDELVDEINPETGEQYTRAEARVVALEQKLEIKDYNEKVAAAQANLSNESFQVLNDFPIFNADSKEYKEDNGELASEAAGLLEGYLVRDPNVPEMDPQTGQPTGRGMIVGSNISLYKLYKTLARASGISGVKGQLKGQQSTEQMLANADTNSSAAPPKKAVDPVLALWQD